MLGGGASSGCLGEEGSVEEEGCGRKRDGEGG